MTENELTAFVQAIGSQTPRQAPAPQFANVTVLGGGPDARVIAALCLAAGARVRLFSAYGAELKSLRETGGITLRGAGPIGTFQIDRAEASSIRTTGELDTAVRDAELIFLTGTVQKQRTYAMVLAEHLHDGQVLALAPGRTFGAMEVHWLLRIGGCIANYTIIETQGLPYWYEPVPPAMVLHTAPPVIAATLPAGRDQLVEALARLLPNLNRTTSTIQSGFADGSGLVELPALLFGGPAFFDSEERMPFGATPLPENNSFRARIGQGHVTLIESLARERAEVAARFGVRDLPDAQQWIDIHAGAERGNARRPPLDKAQAIAAVRDGTIGSLVPLCSAAALAELAIPTTTAMVALASSFLGADVETAGRKFENIGVGGIDGTSARKALEIIARGAR
jgi:opine dehydrogenase